MMTAFKNIYIKNGAKFFTVHHHTTLGPIWKFVFKVVCNMPDECSYDICFSRKPSGNGPEDNKRRF